MSRKVNRIEYHLDSKGIKNLPYNEIAAILRGADDIIMSGGRNLLSKILKGSKEKKIMKLELFKNPSYGYYLKISIEEILAKIDWMIINDYMDIQYDYRLPLICYKGKGWEIEMDTYSSELLEGFDRIINSGADFFNMNYLKDKNRNLILLFLDKVEGTRNRKYIPLLEAWQEIDYKKVRQRISQVIQRVSEHKES